MVKKIIITGSIIIAIVALMFLGWSYVKDRQKAPKLTTTVLAKSDLADSILASGTIISSNSKEVYSKLPNYYIKELKVDVGDRVKAGDVLAVLDTAALEADIRQAGLNIKNAQTALANEEASNKTNLESAQNNLDLSEIELENAQKSYDRAKEMADTGAGTTDSLNQAETMLKKARLSYSNAEIALKNSRNRNTAASKNSIEIQKIMLEKQQKSLADSKITAPIDGTVTLNNAKAGSSSTGLLFIVEDTNKLKVKTAIGEYDIGQLKTGLPVAIKSDSTGDAEFKGTVSKIAPAAARDISGNISSNVQYDTEISMDNSYPDIRIGMNVRLSIKLNEKKDIFAVPYEAVVTDQYGDKWINVLQDGQDAKQAEAVEKIKVTTGMETDMFIEIQASSLKEGLHVITNPQDGNAGKA